LDQFANIRKSGIIAINLRDDDELISVKLTDGKQDVMMATKQGYLIRFEEEQVRPMGRAASGVKGISLRDDDEVVSMEIVHEDSKILHVTSNGYGKQTAESEYRKINRGGKGVYTCRLSEKTGEVVAVKAVTGEEDLMLITIAGVLIRITVEEHSQTGQNAMGVHLIH